MSALFKRVAAAVIARAGHRPPDFIVGGAERPYLRRWWLIPRNPVFNVYLHQFLRDDDDRALHDHPWFWCSILLRGDYVEHTIAAGGVHRRQHRTKGSVRFASPWRAHRIELFPWFLGFEDADPRPAAGEDERTLRAPCWTLFITGPRVRSWGFHCPEQGWVHWKKFTSVGDPGAIGPGCEGGAA